MNVPRTDLALVADFDPEYLRHVSDDVTAHWDEEAVEAEPVQSRWQRLTTRMKAFYAQ